MYGSAGEHGMRRFTNSSREYFVDVCTMYEDVYYRMHCIGTCMADGSIGIPFATIDGSQTRSTPLGRLYRFLFEIG